MFLVVIVARIVSTKAPPDSISVMKLGLLL